MLMQPDDHIFARHAERGDTALSFQVDGAQKFAGVLSIDDVAALRDHLASFAHDRPGVRLCGVPGVSAILGRDSRVGRIVGHLCGAVATPVRTVLFDKSADTNWALGWHQDRTIAVRERMHVDGYGPWTVKAGLLHVAPPFAILERMITVRIHLDAVPADNAPLKIAPGSHRFGRVDEADVPAVVAKCGTALCLAEAGDVWAYATPLLHASDAAVIPSRRRVLQADFAAFDLPGGLAWLGI